jgi:predicted patatin/cPLA2 family phospholipase
MKPGFITGDQRVFEAFFDPERALGFVGCAGGLRNSFLAGAQVYMRRKRLYNLVKAHIGVSSGIATQAYFLGKGKATDTRVFPDDMTDVRMFRLVRRIVGRWPFDVDYVDAVFRRGITGRPIDADEVLRGQAVLYGVLADPLTGKAWSERPATADEVWQLAAVATAVTGFARETHFRGRLVTDGYASDLQLPVAELLQQQPQLTDIVVFAAQHFQAKPKLASRSEMLLYRTGIARASQTMQELILTRHIRFMREAERVIEPREVQGVRVCIVWLPEQYHPIFMTRAQARNLIQMGYATMKKYLEDT